MPFEYDSAKSEANRVKHGIDFEKAQRIWQDDNRFEISGTLEGEARSLVVGVIGDKHWTAIITYRGDAVRIISVRRARVLEIECYEG